MTSLARASTPAPKSGPIRAVHALTVGEVQVRPKNIEGTGTPMLWWTLTARTWSPWLPVLVFVIEHERGTVLFDSGQSRASVTDSDYYPRGLLGWVYRRQARFRVEPEHDLPAQLAAIGHEVETIGHVVISHLHQDHAGNLTPFAHARVLVSAAELAILDEKTPELHGVLAAHLPPPGVTLTPVDLTTPVPSTDAALASFEATHDLFGDGSLTLLPTPGHSAGSMSLLIRLSDAAPLLLVGDVTYDTALLARGIVPDVGDRAVQQETAKRISALTDALPTLCILPAHDPTSLERLATL